ncbi:MAG: hypothetical protein O6950_09395 [Gammaproteobacteria bacterium]|nr:hypothetical protein [Gammaproteobacteria bacterium]
MDPADLYREEVFTDRKVGTIRRLTPVKVDGSTDAGRQTLYLGQAQVLTAVGAVPLSFEIDASSLEGAVEKFSEAAKEAVDRAVKELQELRRETTSPILVPGSGVGGPGGLPGGGVIPRP